MIVGVLTEPLRTASDVTPGMISRKKRSGIEPPTLREHRNSGTDDAFFAWADAVNAPALPRQLVGHAARNIDALDDGPLKEALLKLRSPARVRGPRLDGVAAEYYALDAATSD